MSGENIGLLTDAGCPNIADPGAKLILHAHENNINVIPLVGPSSILLAMMGSELNGNNFSFNGYLPVDKNERSSRIKKLEGSEEPKDLRELNQLKQRYTLGKVNFDSVIIIDFGDGLKSILTSLAYTDVSEKDVLIIAANQWFDDSILNETSISNFYFPSVDLKNFNRFKKKFYDTFDYKPNDVTILSYDSVGLIYYLWKKNVKINSVKDFNMKNDIKGKIGKFRISENKVIQKLNIYQLDQNTFVKSNL